MKRLVAIAVLLGVVVAAYSLGLYDLFGDPERLKAALLRWGAWGYLLYLVSFSIVQPLGIPGILFIIPASLVWPAPVALILSVLGGVGAAAVGFVFARFIARDWVAARLPPRLKRFDDQLGDHAFKAVVVLRLVFFLAPPAHWVLGLSRARLKTVLAGTAVGLFPGVAVLTLVGGSLSGWLAAQPPSVWLVVAVAAGAALALRWRWARTPVARGQSRAGGPL